MSIQTLPNDLGVTDRPIQIYDYHISNACIKNKVNLAKNVISFLVEGTKELITHDTTTTIGKANFLIIKSGNCLMSENLSSSNTYRSILLFFDNDILLRFMEKYKYSLYHQTTVKPYHICNYDHYLQNFVQSLCAINHYPQSVQQQLLPTKFEEVMIYLIHKKGVDFLYSLLDYQNNPASQLKNVVESNVMNNLTVQELAFLCNMSLSTFKRAFEKQYQTSPMKWFLAQRLAHSAFLLSSQQHRPSDIFRIVGFETLSSFIQAFKQAFGKTPKQFQAEKMNV
jgi:AraC family transcriptional regulator, exoenzyme S synthesis regulatory protein ExsA